MCNKREHDDIHNPLLVEYEGHMGGIVLLLSKDTGNIHRRLADRCTRSNEQYNNVGENFHETQEKEETKMGHRKPRRQTETP